MLMWKIPKRCIVKYPGELKDFFSIIKSSSTIKGSFIKSFEEKLGSYLKVKEAIAVSSGRFAMILILKALGVKKGDGVILSAYNFPGVPKALLKEGYDLQFVDADKDTYQIDIQQIEKKIDNHTKAIIVTHLFGQPVDMNKVKEIAKKHNLFVIEDAAHAFGTLYENKFAGAIADAGFFSFTGSKTLNTSFGGMIVTNNLGLANKIRTAINEYAFPKKDELIKEVFKKYLYTILANRIIYTLFEYPVGILMSLFNIDSLELYKKSKKQEVAEKYMRFTNLQGLIGLRQIDFSKELTKRRRENANEIINNLKPSVPIQKIPKNSVPNYFMLTLKVKNKFDFFKKMLKRGIDLSLYYASDCSFLNKANNPVANFLSESILTIHLPFDLKQKEINYIASVINDLSDYYLQ